MGNMSGCQGSGLGVGNRGKEESVVSVKEQQEGSLWRWMDHGIVLYLAWFNVNILVVVLYCSFAKMLRLGKTG